MCSFFSFFIFIVIERGRNKSESHKHEKNDGQCFIHAFKMERVKSKTRFPPYKHHARENINA